MGIKDYLTAKILAQTSAVPKIAVEGLPNSGGNSSTIFDNVLNVVYFSAGTVAVIVLIIAGFLYVTSSGDPGKTKVAKDAIVYTVMGLIFVITAAAITAFVRSSVSK